MATLADLLVRIRSDSQDFEKTMGKVEKKWEKFGSQLQGIGTKLTTGITLPLAALGGGAFAASVDFESAFAGVRKTVDATEAEFGNLRQGIRDMATDIPQSATDIAGIAEAAGQLGIQTENILSFTRVMADLGVATDLTGQEAATSLARLANITQMPQTEFDKLGSTIVALGNNLATTEAEIVEMGLRIAGAGSQIGLTESQILGFAGALSSVGINAEAGGSAISRVMIGIANQVASGGEKLGLFAQVAGMSASEFQTAFKEDAAGALITFIEGLGNMSAAGENVFGVLDELGLSEIRVRDALLRASGAGDLFRNSIQLGSQAWQENTALTKEAEQRYGTTESQLTMLWNRLKDVAITFGDALVPAMMKALDAAQPLLDAVTNMATWFANLDPGMQRTIITIAALVAALGPVLFVVGTVVKGISGLIGVTKLLAGAFTFLLSPIGIIVLAIAALAAIFLYLWNTNEEFKVAVIAIWQAIVELGIQLWGILSTALADIWQSLQKTAMAVFERLQVFWDNWGDTILAILKGAWDQIELTIVTAINLVKDTIGLVMAIIRGDWEEAWNRIQSIGATVWKWITGTLENLGATMGRIWDSVEDKVEAVWTGIVNTVIGAVNKVIDGINWMIRQLNRLQFSFPDWVPGLGGQSFGLNISEVARIPMLAEGGIVNSPTLAMIGEAGPEAVVPLDRAGFGGGKGVTVQLHWSSLARPSDYEIRQVAQMLNRELGRLMGGA